MFVGMVPFVVHAIFGFRGVDHNQIDSLATEILLDSISSTSKDSNGENLFFLPGDVKILMISPWHQNVLNVSDTMLPEMSQIGTKIVFEIQGQVQLLLHPSIIVLVLKKVRQ